MSRCYDFIWLVFPPRHILKAFPTFIQSCSFNYVWLSSMLEKECEKKTSTLEGSPGQLSSEHHLNKGGSHLTSGLDASGMAGMLRKKKRHHFENSGKN